MTRTGVVYGLVDPRTDEVRYIGRTVDNPRGRLYRHLHDTSDTHKVRWISSIKDIGLLPTLLVLEDTIAIDALNDRECWWIALGVEQGWRLTNGTRGGDGLVQPSQETLEKMRVSRRKRPPATQLTREKIAQSHRGSTHSDEWNESVRRGVLQYYTDEMRALKSAQMSAWWAERRAKKMENACE